MRKMRKKGVSFRRAMLFVAIRTLALFENIRQYTINRKMMIKNQIAWGRKEDLNSGVTDYL